MARFWPFWTEKAVLASFSLALHHDLLPVCPSFGDLVMQGTRAFSGPRTLIVPIVLFCLLALGCAGKNSQDGSSGTIQPLPPYPASQNERVYVSVTGGTRDFNNDLSSLVVASLQSDLRLVPADSEGDANILIDIAVRDLYVAAIGGKKINGGHALANTAMATSLGIVIGSIAGDRDGALVGAGIGAAVGLGVTAMDADTDYTWQLDADVTMRRRGEKANPLPYSTTANGTNMERQDAEYALKNQLSVDVVNSLRTQ